MFSLKSSLKRSVQLVAHNFAGPVVGIIAMGRPYSIGVTGPLMTPNELQSNQPKVIALDCSWFLPNGNRDGKEDFKQKRIPKARFFDLDHIKDNSSPYPHMLYE